MSDKNVINKVIKENYKINEIEQNIEKINEIQREYKDNNDNSFNQLLSLQLLIQKYSGLKELCKQSINIILKKLIYLFFSYK